MTKTRPSLDGLGARIRSLRKAQRLSLVELSSRSKVSVAMISQIETGQATPSLKTLEKLRAALDVTFGCFFGQSEPTPRQAEPIVVRRASRRKLDLKRIGLTKELLSPDWAAELEVMMLVLAKGGGSGDEPWVRTGEKAGLVLSGGFELTYGDETYDLNAGDSFQFDSSIPHMFRNTHDGETQVLWIIKGDAG
jgi:transcriptional regulator with XRE-family HTH domain